MAAPDYTTDPQYKKINRFFVEQISQLDTPVIDVKPNRVVVGPYKVITNKSQFEVWHGSRCLAEFSRRSWGVGYAICLYRGSKDVAQFLVDTNAQYSKLDEERYLYNYHIDYCNKNQDYSRADIFKNRLSRVDSELFVVESRVETILKSLHI